MSNTPVQSSSLSLPKFNWSILISRAVTFGVGGFAAAFTASYQTTHNVNTSLSTALTALLVAVIGGSTYDNLKFQDSVRAAKALISDASSVVSSIEQK